MYEKRKQSLCVWRVQVSSEVMSNEAGEVGRARSCRVLWAPVRVFVILLKTMGGGLLRCRNGVGDARYSWLPPQLVSSGNFGPPDFDI